jgi:hypothetical protein
LSAAATPSLIIAANNFGLQPASPWDASLAFGRGSRGLRFFPGAPWMCLANEDLAQSPEGLPVCEVSISAPFQVGVSLCSATNAIFLIDGFSSKDGFKDVQ